MAVTLEAAAGSELVIRKSRFIGCVEPVQDRAAALASVSELRARHPGATHVCWALHAGGQSAAVDDGEPGGTAGMPMLRVLMHHDLDGVLATTVRYFGGAKLGAGGLVRAYTESIASALQGARKVQLQPLRIQRCVVPYALEGAIRRELAAHYAKLTSVEHGASVTLQFVVVEDAMEKLSARLEEVGQGRLGWIRPQE